MFSSLIFRTGKLSALMSPTNIRPVSAKQKKNLRTLPRQPTFARMSALPISIVCDFAEALALRARNRDKQGTLQNRSDELLVNHFLAGYIMCKMGCLEARMELLCPTNEHVTRRLYQFDRPTNCRRTRPVRTHRGLR